LPLFCQEYSAEAALSQFFYYLILVQVVVIALILKNVLSAKIQTSPAKQCSCRGWWPVGAFYASLIIECSAWTVLFGIDGSYSLFFFEVVEIISCAA